MPLTRSSVSAQRKSLDKSRRSEDFLSGESTVNYIWQYSETHQQLNPSEMDEYIDTRRKERDQRTQRLFSSPQPPLSSSEDVMPPTTREIVDRRTEKTKFNIEKSLKMLDDAVGTPRRLHTASPLLRTAGTPAPLLRGSQPLLPTLKHSSYTPSRQSSIADGDFDLQNASYLNWGSGARATMMTGSLTGKHFDYFTLANTRGFYSSCGELLEVCSERAAISLMDDSGYTKPVTPTGQFFLEDIEDKTSDISQLTGYSEKDAIETAYDALLEDFSKSLATLAHSSQVFELVEEYEKLCNNTAMAIHSFTRKTTPGSSRFSRRIILMDLMNQEKYTWRLIATLFRDRLENVTVDEENFLSESLVRDITQDKSEKEIVQALYSTEASTRRNQIVIDWLEKNNEDFLDTFIESENVEYFGNYYNWENTLHSLEQAGPMNAPKRPFVTEMDPDAPVRQNRPIADLDVEDEKRLLKHLFAYIRAGKLQEAQELCIKCGQAWRAATMEGWKLYHNPNTRSEGPVNGNIEAVEGNCNRDIWKNCCWGLSEQDAYYAYERAIYAALGGNLSQLLHVCISWEDYLWAYFKVMVDVRVEQELRTKADRALEKLHSEYWDQVLTQEKIFQELHASTNEAIREASNTQFHIIQKHIILNNTGELIEEMYNWLQQQSLAPQMLRFMAHLILFLRTTGLETKDTMCNSIVEAFVEFLIKDKQLMLVAVYTSHLPPSTQVAIYARFLEEITDKSERKLCFQLAESCDLDIASITKTVVENIRGKDDFEMESEDSAAEAATSDEDRKKIEAIEWLVFDPVQRAEAVKQSNAIMRCFLALRKHEAARNIFEKLPDDSIDVIHRQWQMRAGDSSLCPEDSNSIREYLCIKAYLDALDTFDVWFEHFHRNAPREPVSRGHVSFTEKVAFEQEQKRYEAEKERWQRALDFHTSATSNRIHNVLFFPGGWMVDEDVEDEPRETRTRQLGLLRQLCIPFLTFLLQSVLSSTNQHKACVQLADVIASPTHRLYEVFRKDELRKVLSLLRVSSVTILETSSDPLGYEMK